jgi:hypothetical protein
VVSLLVAVAVNGAARQVGWSVGLALFVIACAGFAFANRAVWFQMSPEAVSRSLYQQEPFPEAVRIGEYIRAHSTDKDIVQVLGSEPEIYFYAHRHSASGYLYMYDLTKSTPFAPAMQREVIHDVETTRPLYIVDVHVPTSWAMTRNSDQEIVEWASAYIQAHYDLIGRVALGDADKTNFVLMPGAAPQEKESWMYLALLKRKP